MTLQNLACSFNGNLISSKRIIKYFIQMSVRYQDGKVCKYLEERTPHSMFPPLYYPCSIEVKVLRDVDEHFP